MTPHDDRTRVAPARDTARDTLTSAPPLAEVPSEGTQVQTGTPAHLLQPAGLPAVPGYTVTREIARGGMGVVYAARDPVLNREVAVKVMHPGQDAGRFVVESKVTARLPHPGVPPVHALGTLTDGRPFLAMKLIAGRTLADELGASGRADLPRLLGAFEQICQTVGFAHSRGIVHRDLKPSNVMVGAFGEVLVLDWGLAKDVGDGRATGDDTEILAAPCGPASETVVGQVKGTPAYMAPEQARGEPVDARADVFALGGVLAVVLTGKPPFAGETVLDTVLKAAQAEVGECFAQLDACGADAELVAVAKRCLAAQSAERYADGAAVAGAVAAYRAGVDERLRRAERDRAVSAAEAREQRKRRKVQLALAAVVALVLAAGGGLAWYADRQAGARRLKDELAEADRRAELDRVAAERAASEARLAGERDAEHRLKAEQARHGVAADLALAADLRRQYKFREAEAALAQAAELARGGAPELSAEVRQARADLAFAVRLDDIRFRKWVWVAQGGGKGDFNTKIAAPEYRRAFTERGPDLLQTGPDEAAQRLASSAVKAELVAALDDWALYEPDAGVCARLLEVARKADPGTWKNRLRDPAVRADKAAVAALAAGADLDATSPAALVVLAELMERRGLDPSELLTAARAKHPTNFELAFALGQWHSRTDKDARGAGPYEAARALRPECVVVLNNLGSIALERGDADAAVLAFKEAIARDPKLIQARANLGRALTVRGDIDGAIRAYQEALRTDPTYAPAHNNLGLLLKDKGDLAGALAAYTEAVRHDPKYALAHFNLGIALEAKGDPAGALASYTSAVEYDPRLASAHYNLGVLLHAKGDVDGAVTAFRSAVKNDPKLAIAHHNLGITLYGKGDYDGALAAGREAVKHNPTFALGHLDLGVALKAKRDLDGAVAEYREAIRLDPELALAHYNLGTALESKGDADGALAAFRKAVEHDPKNPKAHYSLGVMLDTKGDKGGALAAYREAVRLDPKYARAHTNLGSALKAKGDVDGAIAAFKEAIRHDPKIPEAHTNLGVIYTQQKRYTEALACARAAIKIDPKYSNAHALLGVTLQQTGDIPGARAALTEAVRLDKRWAELLADLPPLPLAPPPRVAAATAQTACAAGIELFNKGDTDGAVRAFKEAITRDPTFALAHYNLGVALNKMGDADGAIAAYKESVKCDPKYAPAHTNLSALYFGQKKYPEAIGCARAALKADPNFAGAYAILGAALQQTGDLPGARAAYAEAIRIDPKKWGPLLAKLAPLDVAPPPREVKR
jgi:tetratricopeptide (TPR) repeat protein